MQPRDRRGAGRRLAADLAFDAIRAVCTDRAARRQLRRHDAGHVRRGDRAPPYRGDGYVVHLVTARRPSDGLFAFGARDHTPKALRAQPHRRTPDVIINSVVASKTSNDRKQPVPDYAVG